VNHKQSRDRNRQCACPAVDGRYHDGEPVPPNKHLNAFFDTETHLRSQSRFNLQNKPSQPPTKYSFLPAKSLKREKATDTMLFFRYPRTLLRVVNALVRTLTRYLYSFFKTLIDHEVTVELKNDIQLKGILKSVDQYLNIKLDDIQVVEELKYPHLVCRLCPYP
jgi:small nuclear ribonucleoprotein (snRNP)-like protein